MFGYTTGCRVVARENDRACYINSATNAHNSNQLGHGHGHGHGWPARATLVVNTVVTDVEHYTLVDLVELLFCFKNKKSHTTLNYITVTEKYFCCACLAFCLLIVIILVHHVSLPKNSRATGLVL